MNYFAYGLILISTFYFLKIIKFRKIVIQNIYITATLRLDSGKKKSIVEADFSVARFSLQ